MCVNIFNSVHCSCRNNSLCMKDREIIEAAIMEVAERPSDATHKLILMSALNASILLDIRDLLKPQIVNKMVKKPKE